MGYCITQIGGKFEIKAKNKSKALEAIKKLAGKETIEDSSGAHFSWVDTSDFTEAKTLEKALIAWRWEADTTKWISHTNGDIIALNFTGEKWGDDTMLFEAIAPYVESGSFIEMEGEDGSRWKWAFNKGVFKEVKGKVVYDE